MALNQQYYIKVDGKECLVREVNEDPNQPKPKCHGPVIVIPSLAAYLARHGSEDRVPHASAGETPKLGT